MESSGMMKRRPKHAPMIRSDGKYWCVCGYQAPRQYRPGSPKAKQAVEQHVQQRLTGSINLPRTRQRGKLVAHIDQVIDGDSVMLYGRWNSTWILPTWTTGAYLTVTVGP